MIIGAMQPHFMPAAGYFGLLKNVDVFVMLDSVQYDKRSWQQRNYFIINGQKKYLTVPTLVKGKSTQKINQVIIDKSSDYISKHLKTIELNYKKNLNFKIIFENIKKIYNNNFHLLSDLNIELIKYFCKLLKIETKIVLLSDLNLSGSKEILIHNLCMKLNCTKYVSTIGSQDYLSRIKDNKYKILYYDFNYQPYENCSFSGLSTLDTIIRLNEKTNDYIDSNFIIN
tara:strand:+ start:233 stop:913 length:681 start_codon:yes stop_codon:yes gene_type:complete